MVLKKLIFKFLHWVGLSDLERTDFYTVPTLGGYGDLEGTDL